MFKDWTLQKWIGKAVPLVVGALTGLWAVIEQPMPAWVPVVAGLVATVAQAIVALIPAKAE